MKILFIPFFMGFCSSSSSGEYVTQKSKLSAHRRTIFDVLHNLTFKFLPALVFDIFTASEKLRNGERGFPREHFSKPAPEQISN